MPGSVPLADRFWLKVEEVENGCWLWRGARNGNGYGVVSGPGRRLLTAHRVAYEFVVGLIPGGLTLDHECRNRACVNPAHLEPVTNRENILRGEAPSALNSRKTHCKRGHPLAGENLYVFGPGWRMCRECRRITRPAYRGSSS